MGSGTHYASELFNSMAGIKTVHVPYKGVPAVFTDTISARLDYGVTPVGPTVPLVKSGRLAAVAVTTDKRAPPLPEVPTVAESGLPGYAYEGWFGMFAPGKLPPALLQQINAEVTRILKLPDVRERIMAVAMVPDPGTPEALHKMLASEIETRRKIFGSLGMLQ